MKKIKFLIISAVLLVGVVIILAYTLNIPAPSKEMKKKIDVNSEVSK